MAKQKKSIISEDISKEEKQGRTLIKKATTFCLICFFIFHILFPFRHLVLTKNPEWTGIASRFAWRMKIQNRSVTQFSMSIRDKRTSKAYNLDAKFMSLKINLYTC